MKKYIIGVAFFAFAVALITGAAKAEASANLSGWLWSSTIGAVSLSSDDAGTGNGGAGTSPNTYHVWVSTSTPTNGTLGGYGWSSNIGWVSFDSTYTSACGSPATIDLSGGTLAGWARATSGGSGGWDGCIKLADTATPPGPYGVTMNKTTGAFSGFGWGSLNVGWLSFALALCPGCVGGGSNPTIGVACSAAQEASSGGYGVMYTATSNNVAVAPQYSWDGGTTWSTSNTKEYPGPYSVGQTKPDAAPNLMIRDGGSGSGVAASPACGQVTISCDPAVQSCGGGGGSDIVGSCSNVGTITVPKGSQITFGLSSLVHNDGRAITSPTTFTWTPAGGSSGGTPAGVQYGYTFNTATTNSGPIAVSASVSDSIGSGTISCGSVNVTDTGTPPPTSGKHALMIGSPTDSFPNLADDTNQIVQQYKFTQLHQNRNFVLDWNISSSAQYAYCEPALSPAGPFFAGTWNKANNGGLGFVPSGQTAGKVTLSTAGVAYGYYQFGLSCGGNGNATTTSTSTLRVVDSSLREF